MLKYHNYDIVFQEIPDEVTLAVNLTNCPHRCVGCHSPHLREDIGEVLNEKAMDSLLKKYGKQITCVCFMGGDGQAQDVETMARHLRQHSRLCGHQTKDSETMYRGSLTRYRYQSSHWLMRSENSGRHSRN